ncbi:hypothetical protein E8E12_005889 [Didymella heteroderae]|uniref:Uncharacterized protein n=1 Tax=Didymella heteroderae TaxID=1769908 RepID=A0A9P4WN05_9PLEO|nr:hypothetical protein E8E12_005889 [Didymella heteroderae]
MCPVADDQQRPDPTPEHPPEGAMNFDEFVRSRANDAQMETLQMCIEHLLRAEQQTHDERERIYHAVSSGRKDLANGFTELLNNDRHGTAQRMGFLVGYASAFRMHSTLLTQARNTYDGHEFAEYYHDWDIRPRSGLIPGVADYVNNQRRTRNAHHDADYVPNNRRTSPGHNEIILDREGRPMTTTTTTTTDMPDEELAASMEARMNGQAATNGHNHANGAALEKNNSRKPKKHKAADQDTSTPTPAATKETFGLFTKVKDEPIESATKPHEVDRSQALTAGFCCLLTVPKADTLTMPRNGARTSSTARRLDLLKGNGLGQLANLASPLAFIEQDMTSPPPARKKRRSKHHQTDPDFVWRWRCAVQPGTVQQDEHRFPLAHSIQVPRVPTKKLRLKKPSQPKKAQTAPSEDDDIDIDIAPGPELAMGNPRDSDVEATDLDVECTEYLGKLQDDAHSGEACEDEAPRG